MKRQELHSYIQKHQSNICQISVLQNGNELYSAEWNGYQKNRLRPHRFRHEKRDGAADRRRDRPSNDRQCG